MLKKSISLILIITLVFSIVIPCSAKAKVIEEMSFTEADLNAGNSFNPSLDVTIGRGDSVNCRMAQSFTATVDKITGCSFYLRLGDNATLTIQIRTDLSDSPESVLYSGNYPIVSGKSTDYKGWMDFEFTRGIKLEKGRRYYLVAWADAWHAWCKMALNANVMDGLTEESYKQPETSSNWSRILRRSFAYKLLYDEDVETKGYPYQKGSDLVLHDAEEYYCLTRCTEGCYLEPDLEHLSEGFYGRRFYFGDLTDNKLGTVYIDSDSVYNLSSYRYLYLDLYTESDKAYTLDVEFLYNQKVCAACSTVLNRINHNWQKVRIDLSAFSNKLTAVDTVSLSFNGSYSLGDFAVIDNIIVSNREDTSFASTYYTEQEIYSEEVPTGSYIGDGSCDHFVYGDINEDKIINSTDALIVLRHSVGKLAPTGKAIRVGDVDGNGLLNATDALSVLRHSVGKIAHFSVGDRFDRVYNEEFKFAENSFEKGVAYHISAEAIVKNSGDILAHDAARLITSLQGLLNREVQRQGSVIIIDSADTDTWIPYITENSDVMSGITKKVEIKDIYEFLNVFESQIKQCGIIIWDPNVPSTANVAQTICALDGYLPVKYLTNTNSLYSKLINMGVEVKQSLVGKFKGTGLIPETSILSTGSVKNDPYLWALENYAARCSSHYLVYCPDGASSTVGNEIYEKDVHSKSLDYNHSYGYDYAIYRRAFCFDLSSCETETPCDDRNQKLGTDADTMRKILANRYYRDKGEFGEIIGFPPWALKYSSHNGWNIIEATQLEGTYTTIATTFNCYIDADGSIPDCSLYCQFPLEDRYHAYANEKPVTEQYDENTVYLYLYTGDYDSAAWSITHLYNAFNSKSRGTIPITWSFTPSLSDRVPMVFDYLYKNQSENDYFSAGDSGIGYIRTNALFGAHSDRTVPDGDKALIRATRPYFTKFGMDSVGFLIGGISEEVCRCFNMFAPAGSGSSDVSLSNTVYDNTPYVRFKNGIGNAPTTKTELATVTKGVYDYIQTVRRYGGAGMRTIKYTADQLKQVQDSVIEYAAEVDPTTTYKFVDYRTFFAMLRAAGKCKTVL